MEKHEKGQAVAWLRNRRLWGVAAGLIVGVLLLVVGGGTVKSEDKGSAPGNAPVDDMGAYAEELEKKLTSLCEKVEGAGRVSVAVTFCHGYEYVYAKDENYSIASDGRSDYRYEYVINGKGDEQGVVYLTRRLPEIAGVGVVCNGGGEETVRNRIVLLLSSTLGISSHKIYVVKGEIR